MATSKPLLPLPSFSPLKDSPRLVQVLDKIRFGPLDRRDDLGEFLWFAREYPRVYRHHFEHAEHRLTAIGRGYAVHHEEAAKLLERSSHDGLRESGTQRRGGLPGDTFEIYWDFESFLSAASSTLDVAARIAGTAYRQETPPNFNRFCKTAPDDDLRRVFTSAQTRWAARMKAYRDCFVHYTPVDTLLIVSVREYPTHWQVRAKLPINPEVRDILGFKYRRRTELMTYATTVWRHLIAFDKAIARVIWNRYKLGQYPVRTERLFFLGGKRP